MTISELKDLKWTFKKLYNNQIYAYKLQIIDEIECLLEKKLSDEDYLSLYTEIEYAYLKLDNVSINSITRCAIDNLDRILNGDETFSLRNSACAYE